MKRILTLIFILFVCLSGKAQEVEISGSRKAVRTSGDVLAFVTPVASLTTVLVLQDWKGLKQGALAGVSTIGMTYALKYLIKKERRDVVAGAALGAGSAYIFTRPFATKHNLSISPVASDKHFGIYASMTF